VRSVQDMEADERSEHEAVRARLERAYDRTSDLATVADALARSGMEAVDALDVSVGVPLRPMAAERCKTLAEILERQGGRVAAEYKYDGLRVQAHVTTDPAGRVRLFSRRLEELTAQFPDVQAALRAALAAGAGRRANRSGPATAIVEGEIVAVDADGALLPFQAVSRRRGRKRGLAGDEAVTTLAGEASTRASAEGDITSEVPVAVFLFDALAVDGRDLLGTPYEERRAALAAFAFDDRVRLSTMQECADEAALEAFFHAAVAAGAEGMMCKAPTAPYKAGNRGYDWIKFKTDYTAELVDTLDLVVIGAFFGRGRRAGWYGALLMACYDADANVYRSVCKLGTGFDDATLVGLRGRFAEHESAVRPPDVDSTMKPDVWLRPAVVMEVQAAEITVSPVHRAAWDQIRPGAGLAARFPRFSGRWRDDKRPTDATTVDELRGLYEAQASRLHPNR
jgi:DNA ligase-1